MLYVICLAAIAGVAVLVFKKTDSASLPAGKIVRAALTAAIYAGLCFVLQPLSFGVFQVRAAEALVLFAVFGKEYIFGAALGCFLSNFLCSGIADAFIGTAATVVAGFCSYALRSKRISGLAIPAAIPPVIINGIIIGAMLTFMMSGGDAGQKVLVTNMSSVTAGEAASCFLGLLLVNYIEKRPQLRRALLSEQPEGRRGNNHG